MKTFRLIGMVLVSIIMCVNFATCSSDDDELQINEDGIVENEKKIVERTYSIEKRKDYDYYYYDNKERLSSIKYEKSDSGNKEVFTWGENIIIEEVKDKNGKNVSNTDTTTYTLLNSLIKKIETTNMNKILFVLEYDSSKRISSLKKYESTIASNQPTNYNYTANFIWEDGLPVKIIYEDRYENDVKEIIYGDKNCKGYFPYFSYFIYADIDLLHIHPELVGLRLNKLPEKIINTQGNYKSIIEFSYTFDENGYIISYTFKNTGLYKDEVYDVRIATYTFKWQ